MNEYVRQIISGVLAGGMASGTAIVSVLQEAALAQITDGQWVSIGIGGFIAAAAGWKTLLARPPHG